MMSLRDLLLKTRRYQDHARVIFDREEPIGRPTDLVMPRRNGLIRRWREKKRSAAPQIS